MNIDSPIHFQGICQGNGSGPTIWVAVSAPLIEMVRGSGHGIKFEALLSQDKDSLVGFTFVDDTNVMEGYLTKTEKLLKAFTLEYKKQLTDGKED